MITVSFGTNLIALREARGMSRSTLAENLDIPYTTLRNYETDQREPGHKLLIKLASLFSVSVDELIGASETKIAPAYTAEALSIAKKYDALDEWGRDAVKGLVNICLLYTSMPGNVFARFLALSFVNIPLCLS